MPRKNQQPEMQTAFQFKLSSDPFASRRNKQVNKKRCDFAIQDCHVLPGGHHGLGPRCPLYAPMLELLFPGWWRSFRYRPLRTDFWGLHLLHSLP